MKKKKSEACSRGLKREDREKQGAEDCTEPLRKNSLSVGDSEINTMLNDDDIADACSTMLIVSAQYMA